MLKAGVRFTFLPILHGSRKWIRDCDTLQKIKHYKLLLFNLFKSLEEQKNVKNVPSTIPHHTHLLQTVSKSS